MMIKVELSTLAMALALIIAILAATPIPRAQGLCPYVVKFNVTPASGPAYVTISVAGIPPGLIFIGVLSPIPRAHGLTLMIR